MSLFQTDFLNGIKVLNRILNHAVAVRARMLVSIHRPYGPIQDSDLDRYRTELAITGDPHVYVGDPGTWNWYRFLAEPDVWDLEFGRVVHEHDGLRAPSEGIVRADRRRSSLREAATSLVVAAGPERAEELRLVGEQLVEKVRRRLDQLGDAVPADAADGAEHGTIVGQRAGPVDVHDAED
jgi:hypothetical protein